MSTFVFTWNSTFISLPPDTEDVSVGAQRIRDFKSAFGERFVVNHSLAGDGNDGIHDVVELYAQVATFVPTYAGLQPDGILFCRADSAGDQQLFFQDSAGALIQITAAGAINFQTPIPSGTVMNFLQAAVPTGWTVSAAWNDQVIRLVNGGGSTGFVGGQSGGSWLISGVTLAGYQLNATDIPQHNHGLIGSGNILVESGTSGANVSGGSSTQISLIAAQNYGSATPNAHTHGFTNDQTWRPAYVNSVVGTKN